MSDFEELVDFLGDATKQLFSDIEDAWTELKEDLRETVTVKYLRPGGVAYCRADGKKYYGILTGTQIISLNAEKEPEYMELADFLNQHGAETLKVAGKNRIAVGSHQVDFAARAAAEKEPEYMELADFLNQHGAETLKVAGKNRIAVGSHQVDFAARAAVEEERFPSTKTFVLKCLGVEDAAKVDEAVERKFGSFDWLAYDLPEESEEEQEEAAE